MTEYYFGGSSFLGATGRFIKAIAKFTRWLSLVLVIRLHKLSKYLTGVSTSMILDSQKHVISDVRVNLIGRHIKVFRFKVDGKKRCCYEEGDYSEIYKSLRKENIEVTEQDFFTIRFNNNWRKD